MVSQNFATAKTRQSDKGGTGTPNIIFITVDELRFPTAFPKGIENASQFLEAYMPNVYKLWQQGVKFSQYYTAASDCTLTIHPHPIDGTGDFFFGWE
jgi:uncharacterized sulfatase